MQTILFPDSPRIVKKVGNRAEIEIAGCAPGYGVTLGNAIRRVLLSSLPGAAITAVNIGGVQHEFTALTGVLEDVVMITLNLKQVRFRMHTDLPVRVALSKKGAGEVRAGDIAATSDLEVANPSLHIATLTSPDAKLEMELEVSRGIGFVPVEEHRREKVEVGLIALDALFSPIRRVNYEVENMRVGERTDFNRIRFDIETDGTMSPEDAFAHAVAILMDHFSCLKNLSAADDAVGRVEDSAQKSVTMEDTGESAGGSQEKTASIDELKLKTRVAHALQTAHIRTVAAVAAKTEEELLAIEGLGEKTVKDIKKALGKFGLTLAEKN